MTSRLRDALASAFVDEVNRVLKTMRVRGWKFNEPKDIGMKVMDATPIRFVIEARIDGCSHTFTINQKSKEEDLGKAVERLVVDWYANFRRRDVQSA